MNGKMNGKMNGNMKKHKKMSSIGYGGLGLFLGICFLASFASSGISGFGGAAYAASYAPAADETENPVHIIKPISGWSGDRLIELVTEIRDPKIDFAYLVVNGIERMVRVKNQRVSEKLVLSPGSNQIVVQVKKDGRMFSDNVVLYSKVPRKDIKIILTWDTDGTDVDLHVINPAGVDCYYSNKETDEGGRLDVDITDGYGPEVFTQAGAVAGEYEVKAHYFSSNNHPQTIASLQVILFEGTDREKRYRFKKILVKTNDASVVGKFNIKELERQED